MHNQLLFFLVEDHIKNEDCIGSNLQEKLDITVSF